MPVRLKGLHYINTVSFMDKILALMRPFMKKELIDVLHLHSTVESFSKNVSTDQLPNEYGGKAGTFNELRGTFQLFRIIEHFEQKYQFQREATS